MNVIIVAQYFPPDMGGGATRAFNAAKGLTLAGCNVTVVSAFPHYPTGNIPKIYKTKILKVEYENGLRLIRTFVPSLASKGFANRLLLFMSFIFSSLLAIPFVGKNDVIWAANPNIISVFPSLIFKIVKGCPIIQNVDDLWPETLYDVGFNRNSFFARTSEFIAKLAYSMSSALTPISPAYTETLLNKYHVNGENIFVIPAGVDIERFNYLNKKSNKNKLFTILYIGAFSPAYDFDQIFNAASFLADCPELIFIIQGGGELADYLKRKVKISGLKNIIVVDKIVSRQEVSRIMMNADALILPLNGAASVEMGISSKLYEYQAAGKPILCCSRGQPGLYVSKTKSGLVVPPGDYKALSEAVLKLKSNPSLSLELGNNGRNYVNNNQSIEKIGKKMILVLRSLSSKFNLKDRLESQ